MSAAGAWSSPCANEALQQRRARLRAMDPYGRGIASVFAPLIDLADCRECDMCGGCKTHEGCLTDLRHIEFFLQFATPGEAACGGRGEVGGEEYACALPRGHRGGWHRARGGSSWPVSRALPPVFRFLAFSRITDVADFDFPDDLLDLQRAWYAADIRCVEAGAALPPARDVAAGVAEPTTGQQAELSEARAERLRVTEALQGHSWWATVEDRFGAKAALRKAARP